MFVGTNLGVVHAVVETFHDHHLAFEVLVDEGTGAFYKFLVGNHLLGQIAEIGDGFGVIVAKVIVVFQFPAIVVVGS